MNIHVGDEIELTEEVVPENTLLRKGEAEAFLFMPHLP